jgi:hypothetical protein
MSPTIVGGVAFVADEVAENKVTEENLSCPGDSGIRVVITFQAQWMILDGIRLPKKPLPRNDAANGSLYGRC